MFKKISIIIVALFALVACSKTSGLATIAKEQGFSQAAGLAYSQLTNLFNPVYLLNLVDSNRVHSVRYGKGVNIKIANVNNNVKLYAQPLNTVGSKKRLFHNNYLLPGNYRLTTSIGTKYWDVSFNKNATVDYYKITEQTESQADRGLGRLKLVVMPSDAKIVIYGTPKTYNEGMSLPPKQYKVKVEKAGYSTQTKTITITKNTLTSESFTLSLASKPEKVSVTGSKRAPKSDPEPTNTEAVERITVTGQKPGKIVVLPTLSDVSYAIVSDDYEGQQYTANMSLAPGEYRVVAVQVTNMNVIASQTVIIESAISKEVVFDFNEDAKRPAPPVAQSESARPVEVDTVFIFTQESNSRARSVFTLVDDNGEEYRFTKRFKGKSLTFELTMLEGNYKASFRNDKMIYELGEIELSTMKSNKIEFKLD